MSTSQLKGHVCREKEVVTYQFIYTTTGKFQSVKEFLTYIMILGQDYETFLDNWYKD